MYIVKLRTENEESSPIEIVRLQKPARLHR